MRIHRLEVEAFGPFASRQTVDFDELSAGGLFLLNGETGAGKTSVLDAICFALYGGLPGAREGTTRLRSDHAADGAAPEVVCEFSTGGRRFEVLRSPAWERPKSRGAGTTKQQAQSRLRELVRGAWEEKSTRNDEVSTEVTALLGLGKEQFTKVAMLPQGEFAAFLRAKDREREALLRRLFDTGTYASVESILHERLSAARAEAEEAERRRASAVGQLRADAADTLRRRVDAGAIETSEQSDTGADVAEATDEELPSMIARLLSAALAASDAETAAAEDRLAASRGAATALATRADDHRQLAEYLLRRGRHEEGAAAADSAARALGTHALAAAVEPSLAALRSAERAASEAGAREADARAAVGDSELAAGYLATAGAVAAARDLAADGVAVAAAALPQEEQAEELRRRLRGHLDEAAGLGEGIASDESRLAELRVGIPVLSEEIARHAGAAASLDVRRAERDAAAAGLDAVLRRDAHAPRLAEVEAAWVRAEKERLDAVQELARLGRLRLAQAAAALAIDLEDGEPCPVCGSAEHPHPAARPGADVVHEAAVEEAERVARAAEDRERAARDRRDGERGEGARLRALAGTVDEAGARIGLERADEALARALGSAERHRELVASEAASRLDAESLAERIAAARQRRAGLESAGAELEEQLRQREGTLTELRAGSATLAARLVELRAAEDRLRRLGEAGRELASAGSARESAGSALARALEERGFPDLAAQQDALLAPAVEEELRRTVAAREAEAVRLETLGAAPGVGRARRDIGAGTPGPDADELAAADAAREAADRDRDRVLQSRAVLDAYGRRFAAGRAALEELLEAQGPVLERYATVRSVAELVRGGGENLLNMTLSTYVLAARLESVAAAATERLHVMSNGRYAMVHDDTKRGNSKSGLGLQVIDAWTGRQRDTATLSGGESFMASLALALGLADVVQQESGGIDMETLFVDEGFGSLDEGALEMVMDALDGLLRSGRTVGVVSHVAEMKQRIPAQLRVHKARRGSRLEVVTEAVGIM
ncbi:MAG: SMC family ATPase [Arthrobacter sp.]|uniref:AAA family ATPase n=1 Tax=Arthrobacter sp. TaxID=1667 RepID=UPI0034889046